MTNDQVVLLAAAISYKSDPRGLGFTDWVKLVAEAFGKLKETP